MLKLHLLPKPPAPVFTLQEQTRDRIQLATDINFAKSYAVFFCSFLLLTYIVAWVKQDTRSELTKLRAEICDRVPSSPACKSPDVINVIDSIARNHQVPTRLIVGIYFAESTLGINFNKEPCRQYHNWAGLKGRKFKDGRPTEYYSHNRRKPDQNGCWLYKFESFEQATESLALTISKGYTSCLKISLPENQTKCISYAYVGAPDVPEQSWINRVSLFYPNV